MGPSQPVSHITTRHSSSSIVEQHHPMPPLITTLRIHQRELPTARRYHTVYSYHGWSTQGMIQLRRQVELSQLELQPPAHLSTAAEELFHLTLGDSHCNELVEPLVAWLS